MEMMQKVVENEKKSFLFISVLAFLVALIIMVTGCFVQEQGNAGDSPSAPGNLSENIAKVGDILIPRSDFDSSFEVMVAQAGPGSADAMRVQAVHSLVGTALILSGIKDSEFTIAEADVLQEFDIVMRQSGAETEDDFRDMVESAGYDYTLVKKQILEGMTVNLFRQRFINKPGRTEDENAEAYEEWLHEVEEHTAIEFFDHEIEELYAVDLHDHSNCDHDH